MAVAITFAEGVWTIEVDPDTGEVNTRLSQPERLNFWPEPEGRDVSDQSPWLALLGTSSVWRWQLTYQQGYADGAQIELTCDDASCVTM